MILTNICSFYTVAGADATNISSMYSVISFEAFPLVILNNSNHFNNASISFSWCWSILLSVNCTTNVVYLSDSLKLSIFQWPNYYTLSFLQGESDNVLPNVMTLSLA